MSTTVSGGRAEGAGISYARRTPRSSALRLPRVALALAGAALLSALPPRADARPPGGTLDFAYDGRDVGHPERAYRARVYVDPSIDDPGEPRPIVVLLHGTNVDRTDFRWMGGGPQPDLRDVLSRMMAAREIPPVVLAAPSTVLLADVPWTMWPAFDLDRFLERVIQRTRGRASIDLERVVLVGHSGGACNSRGSLFHALAATTTRLRAVIAVDGCMEPDQATLLARAPADTDVVVTWQTLGWKRSFDKFAELFRGASPPGAVRVLDELHPPGSNKHDDSLALTLSRYLPSVLARGPAPPL